MAGIYLHIPFCRQACHYCNFHFSTSLNRKNDFIPALLKEMQLRKDYTGGEPIETIYFGGGTPSLLETDELNPIIDRLHTLFPVAPGAEITLEANPDDINAPKLREWRKAGVNRLSIGVQSFFDEDLRWMNRAHDAGQAASCIEMAQREGFGNISIDLIYGGPTLPDGNWKANVDRAVGTGIPHLSCYALTVEPRTALDTMIQRQKKQDVSPEDQARQFLLLMDWTAAAGYEHYEISNFAVPGKRSRHNSSYWQGKTYLGLGPSAHSFNGKSREWNLANNAKYIAAEGSAIAELEVLTPVQQLNEYIMISLRTSEGCSVSEIIRRFGAAAAREFEKNAGAYILSGRMRRVDDRLQLTREGKLLADGIASELFFEPSHVDL
ncbi:radical SAM family heme chaperone HemW [Puia sp. P3]|uniref:radical SAM family heme chaperone HemW n=1 Tax=Puia sp. P3 TaxID=3423952 RepID=UPI003D66FF9C